MGAGQESLHQEGIERVTDFLADDLLGGDFTRQWRLNDPGTKPTGSVYVSIDSGHGAEDR